MSGQPRVLFCYRPDVDEDGGAATVMRRTADALRELDVEVDLSFELFPDPSSYDIVHAFNIWRPDSALEQLRHLRHFARPIAWLPFHLGWSELSWASAAITAAFDPSRAESDRAMLLQLIADGLLEVNGMTRWSRNEVVPGFTAALREMVTLVDHICCISRHEARALAEATSWVAQPWTLTPHGVDAVPFQEATPDAFAAEFGIRDYILCVGAVDARKNQLLLVEALRGSGLRLVLLGPAFEPEYLGSCLAHGGDAVVHIDRVPQPLVASALAGARAHVLPSFAEGAALANLEAAVAGCPMVVSNRSSELEYFGDVPFLCDPCNVDSIRSAALAAVETRGDARWARLAETVAATYSWRGCAEATLAAYQRMLAPASARAALAGARSFVAVVLASEVLAEPTLLAGWDERFGGGSDATLVVYDGGRDVGELESELLGCLRVAGLDPSSCSDLLAVSGGQIDPVTLAQAADVMICTSAPGGPLAALPTLGPRQLEQARALAEQRWAAAA